MSSSSSLVFSSLALPKTLSHPKSSLSLTSSVSSLNLSAARAASLFIGAAPSRLVTGVAQSFNGYEVEGRPLRVNAGPAPKRDGSGFRGARAAPRFESGNSGFRGGRSGSCDAANRLYVGNLSWGVDNLALENLFSEQGKIVEARVEYDRYRGRSRGFGFVTYSSAKEANSAVETLNGVDLNGRSIRVTVAESKPRRHF